MNITDTKSDRSAGILLHISSLPGNYACGDFGPRAYEFARKLKKAGQKYWQILPLNPLDSSKGFSPYSPLSAFAGNTLFINPEMLMKNNYLYAISLPSRNNNSSCTDYHMAQQEKDDLLQEAFLHFQTSGSEKIRKEFLDFCQREAYWLDDFALYISIRNDLMEPWFNWPANLRDREPKALELERKSRETEILKARYFQFLFTRQWQDLKTYCHKQGVKIVGDISIYTSHDSADVWAHPDYFKLTPGKALRKSAGVPPDYFNDQGQLWNMPVYDWKVLEKDRYGWWIDRLKKNLELYDIVRIDHFRGFSSYWEVSGGAENAIKGRWIRGPREKLFEVIRKAFPEMPFIAEDLGDVDQPVFDLRDKYELPGMRILQFAFEGKMPRSIFIPHNYTPNSVVYTGTHDNNTVRGWYKNELSKKGKKNMQRYLGRAVSEKNCHALLIREAYRSVARTAIIPMQDILGLGVKARMNFPSTETGNWLWRLRNKEFKKKHLRGLKRLSMLYNRC